MKRILLFSISILLCLASASAAKTLRQALGRYFLIGTAANTFQVSGRDPAIEQLIADQFNAVVPENCMKGASLQPVEGRFHWAEADQLVRFAEDHHMTITGHCLVWHSQQPSWMFVDREGRTVSRDTLIERMHRHIAAVVGRYRGRIHGWDVVNEVINDDGTMRQSPYLRIIGPEYIEMAFRFAHEADPNAELYINDYSMSLPAKCATMCRIIRQLKAHGLRIDAAGMQSHLSIDSPNLRDYERSMDSLAACGVKVMITELDVNVLPNPRRFSGADVNQHFEGSRNDNPFPNGLDSLTSQRFEQRYLDLFRLYRKHSRQISRVTLWGVTDATSWLNNFPVHGRTNYPLLFDRQSKPKPVVSKIIQLF